MAYLDPDYRRSPKTDSYCVRCQRDFKLGDKTVCVSMDWESMQVTLDENGTYRMGLGCAKRIGLK